MSDRPQTVFGKELKARQSKESERRWLFVPYDQLSDQIGPLSVNSPDEMGVILIENPWKAARRPYHKQKLALVLANMRHFALEQAERGVAVRHVLAVDGRYSKTLSRLSRELGPLVLMTPAERELRVDLQPLVQAGALKLLPHEGWLTTSKDFRDSQGDGPPWRMDAFYRHLRKSLNVLMDDGKPLGGKYSHDADNRQSWDGDPPAPKPPRFDVNPVTQEVGELIESRFANHPGKLDLEGLPATLQDARSSWRWARDECMEDFGPFEDAMSTRSGNLFHTRISLLLNIHRLLPSQVLEDVLEMDIPLNSKEGFVRQLLGWREFMRHVHQQTDGFRSLPERDVRTAEEPGDAGFSRWAGQEWERGPSGENDPDGGAKPSFLGSDRPLPPAFWGAASGLHCLDHVVDEVWKQGYGHHITRLMVLSNMATLLDVSPRELADWFWVAYTDAYDWVVEPNVLGMGTFGLGDLFTTKPYVSGAAYINRMSDYCRQCRFSPTSNCPVTKLYWAFLDRHADRLRGNRRMSLPLASLKKRKKSDRRHDQRIFEAVSQALQEGKELDRELFE